MHSDSLTFVGCSDIIGTVTKEDNMTRRMNGKIEMSESQPPHVDRRRILSF